NGKMQFPGWTNAWTMPIKTRVDMLTTGVRTPIGIKIFGTELEKVEEVGVALEHLIAPVPGTRSVLYERNLGGLYLDIIPDPEALARYGLRVADVERVIESAIGGTPIGVTIEGLNRFSIHVRYPQDLRGDLEWLKRARVPIGPAPKGGAGGGMPMGTQGALEPEPSAARWAARLTGSPYPVVLAQNMEGMSGTPGRSAGPSRPRLPASPGSMSDAPSMGLLEHGVGKEEPVGAPGPELGAPGGAPAAKAQAFVPLGQLADIRVAGGPPMVRDEAGLLVGYVYVDIDQSQRDLGGYVGEAKEVVNGALANGAL